MRNAVAEQTHANSLLCVLAVFALLLIAFYFRAVPLALEPVRDSGTATQFDTTRALARLATVLDGTPHPVDSQALDETRARLLRAISAMGYVPVVHSHDSCVPLSPGGMRCARVENVYFRAGPATGPALVLTAHYDSVDVSPGFGDDGIGLAVWLEVAYQLRQQGQAPEKPVVFLFTDGEEANLLGARAFIANRQDYGIDVARVINLEARGVRGPALMFETSHPNAGVVGDWARNATRPVSNSMMTAFYELLPNSTDLTEHLKAGFAGINIAIADGRELYHSNRDDLASLNGASLQHMGDQALGATRAFLAANWNADAASGEIVYADIAARWFVMLPQTLALALLILCLAVSALFLLRPSRDLPWRQPDWRATALPPLLLIGAGVLAFVLQQLMNVLRPESAYWTAYPQALNMLVFSAVLLAAGLLLAFFAPRSPAAPLFAAGCFWLLLPGVAISLALPGFAMIYLIPALALLVAGGIGWWFPRYRFPAHAIASVFLALHFFPVIHLIDVMLGLGTASVHGVMEAMVLVPMLALSGQVAAHRKPVLLALASVLGLTGILTFMVPAYSVERPLALNFIAHYDVDQQVALLFTGTDTGSLPEALNKEFFTGDFESPPGIAPNLPARELDFAQQPKATAIATVLDEAINEQGERTVTVRVDAPGARGVRLSIAAQAEPLRFRYEGQVHEVSPAAAGPSVVEIVGRRADGAVIDFTFAAEAKADVVVQGMWSGLPDEAQPLANLRTDASVRNRMGDITVTTRTQLL